MDLQSPIFQQGYGMLPKIPMKDQRLSAEAKSIYAYLCTFADEKGESFPPVEMICKDLGISDRRFFKHRKQLVELGYISMQRPRQAKGFGQVVYTLNGDPEHVQNVHVQNEHVQNVHIQNVSVQNVHVRNVGVQNVHVQNDGTNNTINNNTILNTTTQKNTTLNNTTPHTPQGGQDAQVEEVQPVKAKSSRKTKPPLARNEKGYAIPTAEFRPDDFEQWYAAYPRHDARDAAIPAWQKAIEENRLPALSVLLETISWQIPANDWFAWNKKHIPLPASYLNASRWQDEKPAPQPQPQPMNGYPRFQQTGKLQGEALHEHNMEVARIVLAQRAQARAEGKPASPLAALTN